MILSMEEKFTSTGIKFWRNPYQMKQYKTGGKNTIISTHVSPEGFCNLCCKYCSVSNRKTNNRIDLDVIKRYISDLKTRGLRAVIITGGGEPTIYPRINDLVQWIRYDADLSVSLITNGTLMDRMNEKTLKSFSWVRVSVNFFEGWEKRIVIPHGLLDEKCILGCSFIYCAGDEDRFGDVVRFSDKIKARYVRVLPDCCLPQKELLKQHEMLLEIIDKYHDLKLFHQNKIHQPPYSSICHQAYFRPYLSEEIFLGNREPGAVYPCDSVVLNNPHKRFVEDYQICHAKDVLDFVDGNIEMKFDPTEKCKGCVFTKNVNLLQEWKNRGINRFNEFKEPITHEEFV